MANKEQRTRAETPVRDAGRPYLRPALMEFGPVGTLTQSGTAVNAENAQNMGTMRQMV